MTKPLLSSQTLNEKLLNMVLLWSCVTHLQGVSTLLEKKMTGILVLVLASTSMQVPCLQLFLAEWIVAFMTAVRFLLSQATQPKWKQYRMYDYVVKELPQAIQSLPGLDVSKVCSLTDLCKYTQRLCACLQMS